MKFKQVDGYKLEALRIKKRKDLEEDTSGMLKFHMVYTVDGTKSEQDVSAVNIQKAEELIKKQYDGKNVTFTSKQQVKENLKEAYNYKVSYDDLLEIQGKIDRLIRKMADNHQDEISPSSNTYRIGLPFIGTSEGYIDLQNTNQYIEGHEDGWDDEDDDYYESLKENYEYVKRAFAFDIYKDGDDFVLLNGDGDEVYRSNNTLDCLKWAKKNSSKYYKADMSFDLDSWNNDFLHEDVESPEKVIENEEKVPQTNEAVGLANMIIKEINGEWETISNYNDLISLMRSEGQDNMIDVISDIVDEENKHVGQLQKCLQIISPNVSEIDSGKSEAKEQLDALEECEFCADDDFGPNSGFDIYLV